MYRGSNMVVPITRSILEGGTDGSEIAQETIFAPLHVQDGKEEKEGEAMEKGGSSRGEHENVQRIPLIEFKLTHRADEMGRWSKEEKAMPFKKRKGINGYLFHEMTKELKMTENVAIEKEQTQEPKVLSFMQLLEMEEEPMIDVTLAFEMDEGIKKVKAMDMGANIDLDKEWKIKKIEPPKLVEVSDACDKGEVKEIKETKKDTTVICDKEEEPMVKENVDLNKEKNINANNVIETSKCIGSSNLTPIKSSLREHHRGNVRLNMNDGADCESIEAYLSKSIRKEKNTKKKRTMVKTRSINKLMNETPVIHTDQ